MMIRYYIILHIDLLSKILYNNFKIIFKIRQDMGEFEGISPHKKIKINMGESNFGGSRGAGDRVPDYIKSVTVY